MSASVPAHSASAELCLTIDGKSVRARPGESVLQCALRYRIEIPRLCTHPDLPAFGACRMCIVEIEGMRGFPSSCTTPASEGMVVRTATAELQDLRRRILELILVEHPSSCLLCEKQKLCDEYRPKASKAGRTIGCHTCNNKESCAVRVLSEELQVRELPVPPLYRDLPLERGDPFIDRDLNLCILCGRCVRVCKAQHGWSAIDFVGRGGRARIGEAFGRSLLEAGCRFCGSCIDVCPTGSLSDRYAKWYGAAARYTATTCTLCEEACAVTVHTTARQRAAMVRAINPRVPLCVLGRFAMPEFMNGITRSTAPRLRSGDMLRRVSWKEAIGGAAERLAPFVGGRFALLCDTTSTLEDRHVFRKFTYQVMRSPHYLEIRPDGRGFARGSIPAGVKAALLTGDFVEGRALDELELLIVQDCYPSQASERAHVAFPAAVMAEVAGTWVDGRGFMRPLRQASTPPGEARADWKIICDLAAALQASGFQYASATDIAAEIGAEGARLSIGRSEAPPAAGHPAQRRTHFRGHRLEERVGGLGELPVESGTPAGGLGG